MIITLLAIQLVLPLVLIAWIWLVPPRSLLGFCAQTLATSCVLFMLWAAGLWLFPPWWAPYAYAFLLFAAVCVSLCRRWPFTSVRPARIRSWVLTGAFFALGCFAVTQGTHAVKGRDLPDAEVVDLSFPLARGTYLVANGGSDLRVNAHMKLLDTSIPRFHKWRGNAYAVDIVEIDRFGLRSRALLARAPDAYHIYGADVIAPCAGEIIAAVDGLPDMQVPERDLQHMAGNHVILRSARVDIVLAHFQPGSLQVSTGELVQAGQIIAKVGNSGRSDEPHLHIHAQRPGPASAPMSGDPLPMRLERRFLVRNDRVTIGVAP